MIATHALRRLTIKLTAPKLPSRFIGDHVPPEDHARHIDEHGEALLPPRTAPTCLPTINTFLTDGLPRLVALLVSPKLEHASLSIGKACHPEILCPYHRRAGDDAACSVVLGLHLEVGQMWGLRERAATGLWEVDFRRIAEELKEEKGK